ncbi:MAG TPA: PAS domain S-box protein [Candidatus Sulfotelmatobacter sp.]|nr:PAS domain S-box protein [Candidatus Sulfotelmatobacter sp.]
MIEASLDPLVTISREGKITDVNRATEAVTGASRDRLIGSDFSNYFTQPEKARQGYQQVFAEGRVTDFGLAIRHASGRVTDVLYNASVFKNEAGEIEGVFAAARDITRRKQVEDELRLSRERLALAQKAGHSGTFDWDIQNNINHWSAEVEEVYGIAPGEFGGTYEDWEALVVPEDLVTARRAIEKSLKTGEFASEWRIRRRNDGEIRWITARAKLIFDEKGQPQRMLGLNMDVTERKRAEEEVRRLNQELEQRVIQRTAQLEAANKELEAFTYSVSHDLRAPLRHISGFSKLLIEEFGSTLAPEAQHHLQRIQEGTRRMGLLVDDLLNLGRIGRHEMCLQVTGLNSVVNETLADLKAECEGRQLVWKIGSLPFVECDPGLMKQVFQNLLSNAVKFSRPRSQAVIEVGQEDKDGTPAIFVRDNGVGFSMKYTDKLFGVFQRLHRAEDFEGTGVGLATVQRIIQKHGGRIWAEAELDKGATFYFTLGISDKTKAKTNAATAGDQA